MAPVLQTYGSEIETYLRAVSENSHKVVAPQLFYVWVCVQACCKTKYIMYLSPLILNGDKVSNCWKCWVCQISTLDRLLPHFIYSLYFIQLLLARQKTARDYKIKFDICCCIVWLQVLTLISEIKIKHRKLLFYFIDSGSELQNAIFLINLAFQ